MQSPPHQNQQTPDAGYDCGGLLGFVWIDALEKSALCTG
jgi:hypothetical protein